MAKLNYNVITSVVARSKAVSDIAWAAAQERFEAEKRNVIDQFENDPVTQELETAKDNPVEASNISKTLGGYGNLFSFIGFSEGYDPIAPIKKILEDEWVLIQTRKSPAIKRTYIRYNFTTKIPVEKLNQESQMPWESASWIRGIQDGISGVGNYMARKFDSPTPSLSSGGIQTVGQRSRTFTRREYLFDWMKYAINRLKDNSND